MNAKRAMLRRIAAVAAMIVSFSVATSVFARSIEITEWMYKGANGEFAEFTNLGDTAVDMTGWSYADSDNTLGDVNLSSFGVLQPGESVILTDANATAFRTAWGFDASVKIIGSNETDNLGSSDEIHLYDMTSEVDSLVYDETVVKTSGKSTTIPWNNLDYHSTASGSWALASVGDVYGSWTSSGGDIGNPGTYYASSVPEPSVFGLLVSVCVGLFCYGWHKRG